MESIIHAIILGIIQGLTEFLPVSSSGHLELAKSIIGTSKLFEKGLLMTIVLHSATALSTIIIFRKEVLEILLGLVKFQNNQQFRFSLKIIISMIPAGFVGFFFEKQINNLFNEDIFLVGCMLIITGVLLFLSDKKHTLNKDVSFKNALIIGVSQAIAIIPGISRSGATISTSVLLGINKEKAAKFSFLMVVPLILGKMVSDIISGEISSNTVDLTSLFFGFISAFITGIIACKWMINLVKKSKLKYFSYYCFLIGLTAILIKL